MHRWFIPEIRSDETVYVLEVPHTTGSKNDIGTNTSDVRLRVPFESPTRYAILLEPSSVLERTDPYCKEDVGHGDW